jgi:hypothetical protein
MSHNTVLALDQAGDALNTFQLSMKVWAAESYNLAGSFFDKFASLVLKATASMLDISANLLEATAKIPGAAKLFPDLAKSIQEVRERATFARDAAQQLSTMTNTMGTEVRKATPLFTALSQETERSGRAAKTASEGYQDMARVSISAIGDLDQASIGRTARSACGSMWCGRGQDQVRGTRHLYCGAQSRTLSGVTAWHGRAVEARPANRAGYRAVDPDYSEGELGPLSGGASLRRGAVEVGPDGRGRGSGDRSH